MSPSLIAAALLLAAQGAPTLPGRFTDLARTQEMVRLCAKLDPAPATRARVSRARAAAAAVVARAQKAGRGSDAARGQRDWAAMRDDVDTSCIVGPGETGRSAYAAVVADYERAIRDAGTALPSKPKGR